VPPTEPKPRDQSPAPGLDGFLRELGH
jgi:hypothetical protein